MPPRGSKTEKWMELKAVSLGISVKKISDSIKVTKRFIGPGYTLDHYWLNGARELILWYKDGLEEGLNKK